ncbi:MAG: hypothetical protein K9N46_16010 [Candidatus Marinimicrobia bacterium]|nr:hypothetical protein [Candidatus Neomarinimicrobiota bacterium]MCF7829581.1 hypothetical protein [Candidatus Neomarinimicrobiota bacterium]MCF7882235.1 hypothetical protein [Candidatus Neomarinimicrobiota bacterium]
MKGINRYTKLAMFGILGMVVVGLLAGCNNPSNVSQGDYSIIQGRVAADEADPTLNKSATGDKDTAVILARVTADGSLETVSSETVHTDVNGHFTLRTKIENEPHLVVVATRGSAEWRAVVSGTVEHKHTTYVAPLTRETTVETDVYLRMKMYDQLEAMTYADIQNRIDADVAAHAYGDAMAVSQLASAIESELKVEHELFFASESDALIGAITQAKSEAQAELDQKLYESGTEASASGSHRTFVRNYLRAYSDAGIDISNYARSRAMAFSAMIQSTGSMNTNLRFDYLQALAEFRAEVMTRAVEARFATLETSDSVEADLAAMETELNASIDAATSLAEIRSAFNTYHSSVIDLLRLTLDVDEAMMADIQGEIEGENGLRAALSESLALSISTEAIIEAYQDYYTAIESRVLSRTSLGVGTDANLMADIFIIADTTV